MYIKYTYIQIHNIIYVHVNIFSVYNSAKNLRGILSLFLRKTVDNPGLAFKSLLNHVVNSLSQTGVCRESESLMHCTAWYRLCIPPPYIPISDRCV